MPGVSWKPDNPDPSGPYDPDAFVPNEPFTLGDARKNTLIGPWTIGWDFSLFKNTRISEEYGVQVLAEAFNFQFPNALVGNRNCGVISAVRAQRIMQLGVKFVF